jgi:hypothetical protein
MSISTAYACVTGADRGVGRAPGICGLFGKRDVLVTGRKGDITYAA